MVKQHPANIGELRRIQRELAKKVVPDDAFRKPITYVAGIDLAFLGDTAFTACVTLDYETLKAVAAKIAASKLGFPYVSTLLFFREGPPILDIIDSVEPKADVYLINAQGIAHPMFLGSASHVGVLADVPTIGVAASRLCGEYEREPTVEGEAVPLSYRGRGVGWVVKPAGRYKPIFVSPGHRVSLESSLEIVRKCLRDHRLPEPLYLAHVAANREKREHAGN